MSANYLIKYEINGEENIIEVTAENLNSTKQRIMAKDKVSKVQVYQLLITYGKTTFWTAS